MGCTSPYLGFCDGSVPSQKLGGSTEKCPAIREDVCLASPGFCEGRALPHSFCDIHNASNRAFWLGPQLATLVCQSVNFAVHYLFSSPPCDCILIQTIQVIYYCTSNPASLLILLPCAMSHCIVIPSTYTGIFCHAQHCYGHI